MIRALLACEESQAVTKEFRKLGVEAYSCDVLPTSSDNPEWHLQQDVVPLLEDSWDILIAFPPCTHLASSGAAWFEQKRKDGRQQGIDFFMLFTESKAKFSCIENPVGIMSSNFRKPDQIVQPYQFGDPFSKRTCLWLNGLPKLKYTNVVEPEPPYIAKSGKKMAPWYANAWGLPPEQRSRIRSKFFPGMAKAMAYQWTKHVENNI